MYRVYKLGKGKYIWPRARKNNKSVLDAKYLGEAKTIDDIQVIILTDYWNCEG